MKIVSVKQALAEGKLAQIEAPPIDCWFLNVNQPEDLARAEALPDKSYRISCGTGASYKLRTRRLPQ